jgi:hypothetical protein
MSHPPPVETGASRVFHEDTLAVVLADPFAASEAEETAGRDASCDLLQHSPINQPKIGTLSRNLIRHRHQGQRDGCQTIVKPWGNR